MTTTQALQNLLDDFRRVTVDKAKTTQTSITQLRNAKKEADITKKRQELVESLKTMQGALAELQQHMQETQSRLEDSLGAGQGQTDEEKEKQQPTAAEGQQQQQQKLGFISARNLTPEQQETLYQLKASRMGAMKAQNQALKRELVMNQRKDKLLKARHARNESYSGSDTLRVVHALECKVRSADLKIKALQDELHKSQQMALKYRELYENSQRESEGSANLNTSANSQGRGNKSARPAPKPAPLPEQSFVGPATNINDVVRKNECLLEENEVLKREVQRLKRDNAELVLMTKGAATSRDSVFNSQLSRSMTRQTADWIEGKRQQQSVETQLRWTEISPVAPHGSKERFREHRAKENTDQPRQMYPVESYA
ncbi:hypothetical protein BaRGS_00030167 [Batillaria attramentaria]|uniref:Uncharacterized protein n=1 Tax=Batillaria attramentaria TaxID=370345 RepID=A0ABD0JUN8_9CAEN